MVIAIVGSGGKTTLLKRMAQQHRDAGRTVLVTTTTHMYREPGTLVTDDPGLILSALRDRGYAMAGTDAGEKIGPLSPKTFLRAGTGADTVLVEADGSRHKPLKFPNCREPVIPENADRILVVCGLHGLGGAVGAVCHRPELAARQLGIGEDTPVNQEHILKLLTEGYLKPLKERFPWAEVTVCPAREDSQEQAQAGRWLEAALKAQGVEVRCWKL